MVPPIAMMKWAATARAESDIRTAPETRATSAGCGCSRISTIHYLFLTTTSNNSLCIYSNPILQRAAQPEVRPKLSMPECSGSIESGTRLQRALSDAIPRRLMGHIARLGTAHSSYPQHIHNLKTLEFEALTTTCCARIHRPVAWRIRAPPCNRRAEGEE
jgi:hypothetical protein